jgi:hypothetical protein
MALQFAFLLTAIPNLWPSSSAGFATTPAEAHLQRLVGAGRVAFGNCGVPYLGILPEDNDVYGVSELAAYDPTVPKSWYEALNQLTGTKQTPAGYFCGRVTSASEARALGASWILEPPGGAVPSGTSLVSTIEGEPLYQVPGAGVVTLQPAGAVSSSVPAQVVAASYPNLNSLHMSFDASQRSVLELHISDVPGWHATIDGHPLALRRFEDAMLQAEVPAGSHTVTLTYGPSAFNTGLIVAAATAAILLGGVAALPLRNVLRSRRRPRRGGAHGLHAPRERTRGPRPTLGRASARSTG